MTADPKDSDFEQVLVDRGWVTPEQLQEALETQKKICETGVQIRIDEVLLRKGFLTAQQLASVNAALGKGRTDLIQGYEIISKLGQGGMGAVYKARQLSMDRLVAIKVLLPSFANEKNAVERFLNEAKVIAKLSHPNLIAGIDAGYQHGIYYCVMEYVEGQTLARRLGSGRPIGWRESLSIAKQIASALAHAEKNNIVHRDVKPENIIIDRGGVAKLMDLGLAKLVGGGKRNVSLTGTGYLVGTPTYMSPEQAQGFADIDIRSDLYSLGLTLYEMLCGKPAFEGDSPMAVLAKRVQERLRFDALAAAGVPEPAIAVVRKLTVREREGRTPNPAALIADVDDVLAGRPIAPALPLPKTSRAVPPPRPKKKSFVPVVVGGVLVLSVGAAVWLMPPSSPGRRPPAAPVAQKAPEGPPAEEKPKPPPVAEAPRAAIEESWSAALKYEQESRSPEDVLLNFIGIKEKLLGSAHIGDADRKIAEWKIKVEQSVKQERESLEGSIAALLAQEKFGEATRQVAAASQRFDRPALQAQTDMPEYRGWSGAAKALEFKVRDKLDGRLRSLREEAAQDRRTGKFDDAARCYETIKGFGVEAAFAEATAELAKLPDERRRFEEDKTNRAKVEPSWVVQAWLESSALAASRDYDGALKKLRDCRDRITIPEVAASIDELGRDMELAAGVIRDVEDSGKRTKDLTSDKLVALYRAAKKTAAGPDVNKAIFLLALFELDGATAEKEMPQIKTPIRAEYRDLLKKAQARAANIKAATDLLNTADHKYSSPKTINEAVKLYREVLDKYGDYLPETTRATIRQKIGASGANEIVIDAAQMIPHAESQKTTDNRTPLKTVVIVRGDEHRDPNTYIEFEFEAKAGVPYKLWLHMGFFEGRGLSVYATFQDDVDIANALGDDRTDRSYVVQFHPKVEEKGFGWTDRDMDMKAYGERVINLERSPGATFKYQTGGTKRIRLYNRESGAVIDRALISSERFLKQLPGAAEAQPKK